MSWGLWAVCAANLAFVGLLPRIFFKAGRFNLRWCVSASPYVISASALVSMALGWLAPLSWPAGAAAAGAQIAAGGLAALSLGFMGFAMGSNRVPLALWQQADDADAPVEIVTWGAYRRIRHPFYTSFLIALGAAAIAFPHLVTIAMVVWGLVIMNVTAAREERRLSASPLGAQYRAYMQRTGRFAPPLRSPSVGEPQPS